MTYTSVAQISPPITPTDPSTTAIHQSLGIISLSDYHILDAPPTLHGLSFGLPIINDRSRTPTYTHFERYTSLTHTIHFHLHEGFKSDDLCYIEVTSPWARGRRAEVHSRIFGRDGRLIATCVQGSYYVMKEDLKGERGVGGGKEGGGVGKL
jgi:acyl-CoA thioesterase